MPLTADEILQRRLTDPYFRIAEEVAAPSLAMQKSASLAAATVEKKRRLDPAQAAADEAALSDANLGDIFEAGLLEARENLFDAISGYEAPEGVDRNEQIRQYAEAEAGLKPGDRQRLVGDKQDAVADSLAYGSIALDEGRYLDAAGNYVKAAGQSVVAAPGTIAESGAGLVELAAGAAATALGGGAGIPLLARRGQKVFEGGNKLFKAVGKAKGVIANAPRAAAQVSVLATDQTQRQINDFTKEHGVAPTRDQAAGMFATTMMSYMLDPTIIKNLFVPKFKKQISSEIRTIGKNLGTGSNLKNIAGRLVDGGLKVLAAGGAEAGQEYIQTWVEQLNVGMGPEQRKEFMGSLRELLSDPENQKQAQLASFLGFGAGAGIRAGIAAPQAVAGTAVDTAKGTAKVTVKAAGAVTKKVGEKVQNVANKAANKVLSEEERAIIKGDHASKTVAERAVLEKFKSSAETVANADTLEEIKDPEIQKALSAARQGLGFTDQDMEDKANVRKVKDTVVRAYKAQATVINTKLAGSLGAEVAKQSAANVKDAAVEEAVKAVEAVSPGVKAVVATVKKTSEKAAEEVKKLRSSTAYGIIELSASAGKEELKTIGEAAKSLSMDDLKRTANIVGEMGETQVSRQLENLIRQKEKALKRAGVKTSDVINTDTLSPIIKDVADVKNIAPENVAPVSVAINETVAGKIDDIETLEQVEAAVKALEATAEFKNQTQGAMSRDGVVAVKRKLIAARARLEETGVVGKTVKAAKKAAKAVKDAAGPAGAAVAEAVKPATDAIKEAVKPETKISGTLRAITEITIETIKDPRQATALIDSADVFLKQLDNHGIKTRANWEAYVEEFPGIQDNQAFFTKLDDAFDSPMTVGEVFDNVVTKAIDIGKDTKDGVVDAYNELITDKTCTRKS